MGLASNPQDMAALAHYVEVTGIALDDASHAAAEQNLLKPLGIPSSAQNLRYTVRSLSVMRTLMTYTGYARDKESSSRSTRTLSEVRVMYDSM